jgi:hypothetical protein
VKSFGRVVTMLGVGLLAAFAIASPASAATSAMPSSVHVQPLAGTCVTPGAVSGIKIEVCSPGATGGNRVAAIQTGGCQTGHFEFWKHDNTSLHWNSAEGSYCSSATYSPNPPHTLSWTGNTCVEYWVKVGSGYVRWGGIPCATP